MKKYNEYMDGVTVSDTLHEKLKHLEAPKKRPQAWKKYGAMAAALVLVVGLGAWGVSRRDGSEVGQEIAQGPVPSMPAIVEITTEPAPAPMPNSPGMEMMGGYEVRENIGGVDMVGYYFLPAIQYGEVEAQADLGIALPVAAKFRDLTNDELLALLGGETNLTAHLNWGGYEVSAYAIVLPDDSLWMLCVNGTKGDTGLEHFSLEVSPNQLPPSCYFYAESEVNNIWERDVRAERYDSLSGSSRRVSFTDEGYGYRFEITGTDTDAIEELVSRLVRFVIAGGGLTFEPEADTEDSFVVLYDENGNPYTQGYDPNEEPTATPTPAP